MAQPIELGELIAPGRARSRAIGESTSILRSGRLAEILLQGLTAFLLLINLTSPALLDGSEARTAAIAAEMIDRGRFWLPVHNGQTVLDLPPLGYSIQMLLFTIFGRGELAVRLPSILFGTMQILCVRGWARRADGRGARRFAQLALLFAPGWLVMTRHGGPESGALAFILIGLAMATRGTTVLVPPRPGSLEHEPDALRTVKWASPAGWLGAGVLWGLAALMLGPICLWVIVPASAVALLARPPKEPKSIYLRWLLGPALAAAVMLAIYSVWPLSIALADAGAVAASSAAAADATFAERAAQAARNYPVTVTLAVLGLLVILATGLARRIPDILGWLVFLLILFAVEPGSGSLIQYGLAAPLAILIGVGLYEIMRRLSNRGRIAGAAALWLVVATAVGVEFGRHRSWETPPGLPVRALAAQIRPHLKPNESLAVVGMPAEALGFYLNDSAPGANPVRRIELAEWQAMRSGERLERFPGLRFVIAPVEVMQESENFPHSDWRVAGQSPSLVLLETVRPRA